jgi:hypothetical protein
MNLPQRETMGLLMASRVRRIDTRKRWHFWPVGSERVCNRTTEPRIRQPARRGNARHTTLQFAWTASHFLLVARVLEFFQAFPRSSASRRATSTPNMGSTVRSWKSSSISSCSRLQLNRRRRVLHLLDAIVQLFRSSGVHVRQGFNPNSRRPNCAVVAIEA